MDELIAFMLAGFALIGSPGPATLSLAATGAAFGVRRGLGFLAGIVLGVLTVLAIIASGVTGLVLALPGAAPAIGLIAALYIAYLAYRIATAPPLAEGGGQGRAPSFLGGYLLALANPKAYAAMAALFSGFVLVARSPVQDAMVKAMIVTAIMIAVDLAWLSVGAALTRLFRHPTLNRAINLTFAVLLLASVVFALLL